MFALAQASHRRGLARIDQKLKSSNAFERDNQPLSQCFGGVFNRAVEFWPANRAGIRLKIGG